MANIKNARSAAMAGLVLFASTIVVLLARQLNIGPARPAPDFRTFGPAEAPIQIQEYSDFACGACRNAAGTLDELLKFYGEGIRLQLKHYPLINIHPWSLDAAAYADCAGERGKFKEYAGLLFESQEKWARAAQMPKEFESFTLELKLDWTEMQACAAAPETRNRIKLETAEAEMKGISATPTFFINGKRAVGPSQLIEHAKTFDKQLSGRHTP